jgi:membrane-bound lytic murein transglycosylase MltF
MLARYSPGWDVQHMSRIMYRESRCNPGAYNRSGATGLLQVLKSHCGWLAPRIGGCNLTSAEYNIRAGAQLWANGGYSHWAATR